MDDLEIHKMLVLSTGHLTKGVCNGWMDAAQFGRPIYEKKDYGWFVPDVLAAEGDLPDCLAACLAFAALKGCSWIMFDRDAEPIDALPYYEW